MGFSRAPVVFFQNDEDRDLFVERRIIQPQRTRVLPGSGVDLERFSPAPATAGPPTFLLVGRLLRDKGVVEFVEAARRVRTAMSGRALPAARADRRWQPYSGGSGRLAAWVAEGIVEYLGVTDDVRPFLAEASAVVLPSYREGLPRSLLEAGAMARPLIATDVPGCRAVVEDGHNGYLCAVRDPASLADAMLRLANLPAERRQAMGEAARHTVERKYGEDRVTAAYLNALAEVALARRSSLMPGMTSKLDAAPSGPPGRRAYVVGDVHGRLDLLENCSPRIHSELQRHPADQTLLVFLGDLIDRGPSSAQVLERLRIYKRPGINAVFLLGNHEEVLLRILAGDALLIAKWRWFGGAECLQSYGVDPEQLRHASPCGSPGHRSPRAIPREHVKFLESFADSCRFGDYLLVHAGIRPGIALDEQTQADLRWIREPFLLDESDHGVVVVHGHTISSEVEQRPNRIGIDTGRLPHGHSHRARHRGHRSLAGRYPVLA